VRVFLCSIFEVLMSKSNTTENDFLKMALQGVDPSWRASANIYIALHTADPNEGGTQTTSEAAYTGYARVPVAKSTGWTDGGSNFSNAALIQFPQCTAGSATATHFSVGTVLSGAGQILYSGALSASLSISSGIQPQFAVGSVIVSED
jgi:hypothetical protein